MAEDLIGPDIDFPYRTVSKKCDLILMLNNAMILNGVPDCLNVDVNTGRVRTLLPDNSQRLSETSTFTNR